MRFGFLGKVCSGDFYKYPEWGYPGPFIHEQGIFMKKLVYWSWAVTALCLGVIATMHRMPRFEKKSIKGANEIEKKNIEI